MAELATPVGNESGNDSYDVVIAGAGLVGAGCALLLAGSCAGALKIALIEARTASAPLPADAPFDARVVALNAATQGSLERVGAWPAIAARSCPYTRMEVWDGEGSGRIGFDCADVRAPALGHIVENHVVQSALLARIAQTPGIALICPAPIDTLTTARIDDGRIALTAGGARILTPLLIAADGARSPLRARLGFAVREWSYGHSAIIGTIRTERAHSYTARQWFTATGPLALLPLRTAGGDCHYSSIVWSQHTQTAAQLMQLDAAAFCRALAIASEHCLGEVIDISGRACVPLCQRHAIDYAQPGVALIGDAAHSIHPLAGQGVNLGFADAAVLAEELTRARTRGLDLGDPLVLGRYQRRRKPHNLAMMAAMEGFKRLFESQSPMLRLARNAGMSGLDALAPAKHAIMRQAMGF